MEGLQSNTQSFHFVISIYLFFNRNTNFKLIHLQLYDVCVKIWKVDIMKIYNMEYITNHEYIIRSRRAYTQS